MLSTQLLRLHPDKPAVNVLYFPNSKVTPVHNARLTRSMSRKGCSPDNAACEGFFERFKTELFYLRSWQDITIDQFMQIVDSYIRWYNEKRLKIALGSFSPIEYRASLGFTA